MPELTVRCETCLGKRFNPQTLSVRFKGKSIGDVLEMRSDEAAAFFSAAPRIVNKLNALVEAGLGYVAIGRSGSTLSGGESQRVKLAAELDRVEDERALYLLDEPTSGLHFADVRRLQTILLRLAERGNTVVVIEHNLAFMAEADRLIDLGPDGGDAGGRVVFQGTPDEAARLAIGHTGKALARYLSRTESP